MKKEDYGLLYKKKSVCKWMLFCFILSSAILLLTVVFYRGVWHVAPQEEWVFRLVRAVIDFGIGAGVAEEIIFRGVLLKSVENHLGKYAAVGITSVVFSMLHITNANHVAEVLIVFLYTLVLAVLLCIIRYKAGNIWSAMAFHFMWNLIFLGCVSPGSTISPSAIITYKIDSEQYLFVPILVCVFSCLLLRKRVKQLE